MRRIVHLITKEALLLLRDWHALALLFVMPAAFILVMSLALQGQFAARSGVNIGFHLVNHDDSATARTLVQRLESLQGFTVLPSPLPVPGLKTQVRTGQAQFLVVVPDAFGQSLAGSQPEALQLFAAPDVSPALYQLFQAQLRGVLGRLYVQQVADPRLAAAIDTDAGDKLLDASTLRGREHATRLPSSVQQNVPAWLLFAMFFIAIPLSTTWVRERQQGTYARLRSMGLAPGTLLIGKLVPYLVVNLIQVTVMLLVGVYIVPWLGGGELALGHAPLALALVASAASLAAVAYALLVANLVSTSEQATIFTGVANLLMAALGGIMVPRFIMPHALQTISEYSPMAWGLDGFLDVFLRAGDIATVWSEVSKLIVFAVSCLLLTSALMRWRRGN